MFLFLIQESEKQILDEIHTYDNRVTTNPTSPSLSATEPPIMTSQVHPDGGPLNKVGTHTPGIMTPLESPLHGVGHASLTQQNNVASITQSSVASFTQNKVPLVNHISDLTKTDEEHAVIELDMPNLSASNLQGPENFHFADTAKPSNPDSATTDTLLGKGATEIPLNDGIVEMNSSAEKSAASGPTQNKSKSRDKDQLVSELEAVSHMLDSEEANGESGINPSKDDIKGKLLDIDSGLFRDEKMHKVDLAGILNEDDSSITDEIRNAQGVQGVKLTDTSAAASETEKTATNGDQQSNNDKSHKKNKFMRYVVTQKAQRRVATPTSTTAVKDKKNNGTGLTDEDEKMINDILEESERLEKTHPTEKGSTKRANRKEFTATPTVSSRMKKIIADKRRKDAASEKQKCNDSKCHNLKDAPKHKEPVPPTKPPRGNDNPVEQDKNTEDTVSSKMHKQQPTIKLKLHDLHPNNYNRKNPGNPVQSKYPTGQQIISPAISTKLAPKLHSTFSATNFIKPGIKVEKTNDEMALLFSRGAPSNKSLIHPYSTAAPADDITRKSNTFVEENDIHDVFFLLPEEILFPNKKFKLKKK